MMRAYEYEQAHGAPSITADSSAASATINTSAAAVGAATIATNDTIVPQLPLQAAGPPMEDAYYPPAQEAAPMHSGDVSYSTQSEVRAYCSRHLLVNNAFTQLDPLLSLTSILLFSKARPTH